MEERRSKDAAEEIGLADTALDTTAKRLIDADALLAWISKQRQFHGMNLTNSETAGFRLACERITIEIQRVAQEQVNA